jgi:uncharacterized protein YkwD
VSTSRTELALLLELTNRERLANGLQPLQWHATLAQVAQQHAEAMAYGAWFDHVDTQGRGVGERLLDGGYNYRWAGENISAGKQDALSTFDWWMQSESHRGNILKPEFTAAGFGYCFIAQDALDFHHYWVQVLASPL